MSTKTSPSEKLFLTFKSLARKYSTQLRDAEVLGFTREDVQQELEIRLYEAILAYGRRWQKYRDGEKNKPIEIQLYLQLAMKNKLKDFMGEIERKINFHISTENTYEVGRSIVSSTIDFSEENPQVLIEGVDILQDLTPRKKEILTMFLQGYTKMEICDQKQIAMVTLNKIIDSRLKIVEQLKDHLNDPQTYTVQHLAEAN